MMIRCRNQTPKTKTNRPLIIPSPLLLPIPATGKELRSWWSKQTDDGDKVSQSSPVSPLPPFFAHHRLSAPLVCLA